MAKKAFFIIIGLAALGLLTAIPGLAHTPLCSCYQNGDGTVTCEGGFSDGSSAAGVAIRVEDKDGKVLEKGKMDEFSEFSFKKPQAEYQVVFDAGPGHAVKIKGKEITD
jgi:type 1 fimbria pilin